MCHLDVWGQDGALQSAMCTALPQVGIPLTMTENTDIPFFNKKEGFLYRCPVEAQYGLSHQQHNDPSNE